jgi:hypothetical protein
MPPGVRASAVSGEWMNLLPIMSHHGADRHPLRFMNANSGRKRIRVKPLRLYGDGLLNANLTGTAYALHGSPMHHVIERIALWYQSTGMARTPVLWRKHLCIL